MPSAEHEQIVAMLSGGIGLEDLSVHEQRAVMEASAGMFPADSDIIARDVDAGGVPSDWVTAGGDGGGRTLLYLHGGG